MRPPIRCDPPVKTDGLLPSAVVIRPRSAGARADEKEDADRAGGGDSRQDPPAAAPRAKPNRELTRPERPVFLGVLLVRQRAVGLLGRRRRLALTSGLQSR